MESMSIKISENITIFNNFLHLLLKSNLSLNLRKSQKRKSLNII